MVPKPTKVRPALKKKAIHQLPVSKLAVKKNASAIAADDPCTKLMSAMLGCWASSGQSAMPCLTLEQQLRLCMDTKAQIKLQKTPINNDLTRFYRSFRGPQQKKNTSLG